MRPVFMFNSKILSIIRCIMGRVVLNQFGNKSNALFQGHWNLAGIP